MAMHPIKKIGFITTIASFFMPFAALAAYDTGSTGLDASANAAGLQTGSGQLPVIIGTVIHAALALVGVIFLILMVYAGIIWMIARGDEGKVEKAKETIINSIIGLVIVVGAYAITSFVINAMTNVGAPATPPASGSTGTST